MVVLVQETHQNNSQNLKLSGFVRANHIPHAHHGIVTFVGTRFRLQTLDAQWKIAQHNGLALKSTILKLSTFTIPQLLN